MVIKSINKKISDYFGLEIKFGEMILSIYKNIPQSEMEIIDNKLRCCLFFDLMLKAMVFVS